APEQLKVMLYGPDGTSVTLHDHGGAGTTDLVGTWPVDLAVSGPGSLADLALTEANGPWVLEVVDDVPGGFGVLQSWSLALTLTPAVTPAEDVPPPAPVSALGATPNPFNPSTVLHFALAGPGRVDLAIYDIRGMLVRRLLQGDLPAGPQDVAWDGADQRGRAVASGLYLARLEAAGVVRERKLTLVR
ncbi:MAG TPA: FlgD immunoglobulin-like domain containing protein, partial [Candidatus Krumholzibacteria bacterium]|nr:FlgD immunoglobulin-like domain containing protein [Candidatus Krumholzibacteria bacterium]